MTAATAVGDSWSVPAGSAWSDWFLAFLEDGNDDVTSIGIRACLRVSVRAHQPTTATCARACVRAHTHHTTTHSMKDTMESLTFTKDTSRWDTELNIYQSDGAFPNALSCPQIH